MQMAVTTHFDTVATSFGGDYQYHRETHLAGVSFSYTTFAQEPATRSGINYVSNFDPAGRNLNLDSRSIFSYLKANR